MNLIEMVKEKARKSNKRTVFPEGAEIGAQLSKDDVGAKTG